MKSFRALPIFFIALSLTGCGGKPTKTETREIGYKGEARLNPFLAASRLLEANFYEVDRKRGGSRLPDTYVTLMVPSRSINSLADVTRYQNWMEEGGHLIYFATGYGIRDWEDESDFWDFASQDDQAHLLLDHFNLKLNTLATWEESEADEPNPQNSNKKRVTVVSDKLTVEVNSLQTIDCKDATFQPDIILGKRDSAELLSIPIYSGRLTILASANPLRNRYIENHDHAQLLLELVDLTDAYSVTFIHGGGTTFFGMLIRYGWMPLIGLGLLIILWIWKNLSRFGPTIPDSDGGTRQFTEHIQMTGRFLWRHKASSALLSSLVSNIRRTIRDKHPHLVDSIDGQIEYLQERTDLSKDQISDALLGIPVKDPASMTRMVKHLKTITESL